MRAIILVSMALVFSSCRMTPIGSQDFKPSQNTNSRIQYDKLKNFNSTYALVLIPNENKMQVLDMMVNRIDSSFKTGNKPSDISVSPDKRRILVTNSLDGTVSSYFRESGAKISYLGVIGSGDNPTSVIFNNSGTEAFVAYNDSSRINVLKILEREKPSVKKVLRVKDDNQDFKPYNLAISDDDNTLFAIDRTSANLAIFKKENGDFVQKEIFNLDTLLKAKLENIIYNQDKLYISDSYNNQIIVFDLKANNVSNRISLKKEASNIDLISTKMVINKNTNKIYVVNEGAASISVVDILTNQVSKEINLSSNSRNDNNLPTALSISNDGTIIYVTGASGKNLSIISTKTDSLLRNTGTTDSFGDLPVFSAIRML
ncbi:MAG: YncE family protein [Candidatus Sericytochromatia bacterium]